MKVVALEEHFTTQAILQANADHPLMKMYRAVGGQDQSSGGSEVMRQFLDLDEVRLAVMDDAGIDVHVLSLAAPGTEELPAETAVSLATQTNDVLAEAVAAHPDRFAAFAALPMSDPGAAAKELDRTVRDLGFVGPLINGHVGGRYLDDQFFWPVFEAAEALQVPVYLHPTRPPQAVVDAYYSGFSPNVTETLATAGWGWHTDTALHVIRLIIGGVFDRFPRLQIIIGHMGEGLPAMLWRVNHPVLNRFVDLKKPIKDYFHENFHITMSGFNDEVAFASALSTIGIDRMMFSVDYPFHNSVETRQFLDGLPIDESDKEKIAHGNAERLLGLGA